METGREGWNERRLNDLEVKVDQLLDLFKKYFPIPGGTETTRDTNSNTESSIHVSAPVPYRAPETFILSEETRDSDDAQMYAAWAFLLGKRVTLIEGANIDLNPVTRRGVKDQIGIIKAVALSVNTLGTTADVAVEFPMMVEGGHECYGVTAPRRGLWFGYRHVEIIHESDYGDES